MMNINGEISIQSAISGTINSEAVSGKIDRAFLNGLSAYELAVKNGFDGTETEWLASLKGQDGDDGDDGYAPTVTTSKINGVTTVTITDVNSTHTATINDGQNGDDGDDGISPTVSTSKVGKVTTITITDVNGTHTATINDGENGSDATVTSSSIVNALGYTPADAGTLAELDEHISTVTDPAISQLNTALGNKQNTLTNTDKISIAKYGLTNMSLTATEKASARERIGAMSSDTVIPSAVTDSHINELIDAKLGVIENGTY